MSERMLSVNDWTNLYDKLINNYDPKLIMTRDENDFVLSGREMRVGRQCPVVYDCCRIF